MKKTLKRNSEHTLVSVRSIMPEGVLIYAFGGDYFVSFDRVPWLRTATVVDVMNVTPVRTDGIRWEALDVDLEMDSLKYPEKYPLVMKRYIGEVL